MVLKLSSVLDGFVGRRCTGFTAGEGTGSVIHIELEPRTPRRRPLTNPFLTDEQRASDAVYSIFIECSWRLDGEHEVVCGAWDDNRAGGPMLTGLQGLVGQRVESFAVDEPGLDLRLWFENRWTLRVFCDQVNEADEVDNYSLFCPDEIITVGTRSRLRREGRDEP